MELSHKIGMVLLILTNIAIARSYYLQRRRNDRQFGKGWRKKARDAMYKPFE